MFIEWVLELRDNIDKHGIRFGLFLTLYVIYRKERRNLKLDKRDEALFHNQRILMEHMGVGEQFHGPPKKSKFEDLASLKQSFNLSRKAINRGNPSRRTIMQNTNWITLLPALLGVLKLILQPFGVDLSHISDSQVNDVVNGVSALLAIVGVFMSHKKGEPSNANTQHFPGDGPAV